MIENTGFVSWAKLDNAAKIFPCTTTDRDPKVFRVACELYDPVDLECLQRALDKTVGHFPSFGCVLKKGIFWYYFEKSAQKAQIHEENRLPCAPIYEGNSRRLLFDVSFFNTRINLEVYHALTDGTGAMNFLKTLIMYYLYDRYADQLDGAAPKFDYDASKTQREADSFFKYYSKGRKISARKVRAYKLGGARFDGPHMSIIEGVTDTRALISKAREFGVTVTALLAAALIEAIHESMPLRYEGRSVCLTVPVNLRNYFKSESARNFFAAVRIEYNFKKNGADFENIIHAVSDELKQKLNEDYLRRHMNGFSEIENNFAARIVPVVLKNPFMRAAERLSQRSETAALSNVGKITVPPQLEKYIRLFDVFVSTDKLQICACSYLDNFVITFTSDFTDCDIQRCFFRRLAQMGLKISVSTNMTDESE